MAKKHFVQLTWFFAYWLMGVAGVFVVAMLIRAILMR